MKNSISFRQYRCIDLSLFAVILIFSQAVISMAAAHWFPDQLYVVSPVAAVVSISLMRWGPLGLLHAVLGGIIFCFTSGGGWQHILVYVPGNLFAAAACLMFRRYPKEEIRKSVGLSLTFGALVQFLMLAGRALMALITGLGSEAAQGFILTDILSLVFTLVIVWIARRVDGLFEDQKHYLFRINRETDEASPNNSSEGSAEP